MLPLRSGFLVLTFITFVSKSSGLAEKQCATQQAQCAHDTKTENVTAMRDSCRNCFYSCFPLVRKEHDKPFNNWNNCLNNCVRLDCVSNGIADGAPVADEFRCNVYEHMCRLDFKNKEKNGLVNKSCGACAKECNFESVIPNRRYCESQCSAVGLPCWANTSSTINKTGTDSEANDSNTPSNSKGTGKLWKWLGPVLCTMSAVISVAIVAAFSFYFRRTKPAAPMRMHSDSSLPPPAQREYDDEGWGIGKSSASDTETFERATQGPWSGLSQFFSTWRCFRI